MCLTSLPPRLTPTNALFKALLRALVSDIAAFHKRNRAGDLVPTKLYIHILTFLEHFSPFAGAGDCKAIHFCEVLPGSVEALAGMTVGEPCCETPEEGRKKAASGWCNYCFGRRWEKLAEARWTNTSINSRRMAPAVQELGRAVDELRIKARISDAPTLEAALEAALNLNKADEASRNKLTIIRTSRSMLDPLAQSQLAIYTVTTGIVDQVHYALLGNEEREAITVLDLIHPLDSPLGVAIESLTALLESWGSDVEAWAILACLSCDFDSGEVRAYARRACLGMRSGFLDYFEHRLARPPYSVVAASLGDSEAALNNAIDSVFQEPMLCLPLSVQRCRQMWPCKLQFRRCATPTLRKLLLKTPPHIAHAEMMHALMRQDLLTTRRARSFTASANRSLCKMVRSEHVSRGGDDPSKKPSASRCGGLARSSSDASGCRAVGDHTGGGEHVAKKGKKLQAPGAFIAYQAPKEKAYKALMAPDRSLTPCERQHMQQLVQKGWADVQGDPEKTSRLQQIALAEKREAQRQHDVVLRERQPVGPLLWGQDSDAAHPVPPTAIVAHAAALGPKRDNDSLVWDDPALRIDSPGHVDTALSDAWGSSIFGCCAKHNICRVHQRYPFELQTQIDAISNMLSRWADSLGKGAASEMRYFAWLHGEWPAEEQHPRPPSPDIIVLFMDKRQRPEVVHFFIPCLVVGAQYVARLPAYPFTVELCCKESSLFLGRCAVLEHTADEIGLDLAVRSPTLSWHVMPLLTEPVDTVPNLKTFRVLRNAAEFVSIPTAKEKSEKVTAEIPQLQRLFSAEDPFALTALERATEALPPAGGAHDEAPWLHGGNDDDAILALFYSSGDDDIAGDVSASDSDESQELHTHAAAAEASSLEDGGLGGPPDEEFDVEDFVRATHEPFSGRLTCALPPWRDLPWVARVTYIPVMAPPDRQMIVVKCGFHKDCSFNVARRLVSDRTDIYRWVYSGRIPVGEDDSRAAALDHEEAWGVFKAVKWTAGAVG